MIRPSVSIDGVDLATHPDLRTLGNLVIQWGRSGRLEQPRPATMSVGVLLDNADENILNWLAPGRRFIIAATTQQAGKQLVFHWQSSAQITPTLPSLLHPSALQPSNGNPAAWDNIPRISPSTRVHLTFSATTPPDSTLVVKAYYYGNPFGTDRYDGGTVYSTTRAGQHSTTWTPPRWAEGLWVGVEFLYAPMGKQINQDSRQVNSVSSTFNDLELNTFGSVKLEVDNATHSAIILSGRLSDAVLEWDEDHQAARLDLIGVDFSAELDNVFIGEQPWNESDPAARMALILNASGKNINSYADRTLSGMTLVRRDVDKQPVKRLLSEVAESTGGTLWAVSHESGDYFRLEDPAARSSLYRLEVHNGSPVLAAIPWNSTRLPASTVYREGVSVIRDTSNLATVVEVDWQRNALDDQGQPTLITETVTVHDPQRARDYGTRALNVKTQLSSRENAYALAQRLLTQTAPGSWTLPAAKFDTNQRGASDSLALAFLDSARRIGLPVTITGVENWVPGAPNIPVYLDGGKYTFDGKHWKFELIFTRAATVSQSLRINSVPSALTINSTTLTLDDLATATV